MSSLFEASDHAKLYSSFRSGCPNILYEFIVKYLSEKCDTHLLALDIGCGSGQGTLPLSTHFETVIGLDISEAQIAEAPKSHDNVSFRVGKGEDLDFVKSVSVDLITVAAALHWMDRQKFYTEAKRVLRDTGVLAVYGYRLLNVQTDNKEAEQLLSQELYETFHNAGYTHPRVLLVQSFFDDSFNLPFNDNQRVKCISIRHSWTIEQIAGLLSTYSPYQKYLKDHPDSTLFSDTVQRLKKIYRDEDNKTEIDLSWPMFLLLKRN